MNFDVVIIGAGASGLMCAWKTALCDQKVLLIDHRRDFAQKLIVSGGGRCNFTNLNVHPSSYFSTNPHFVKSALARFKSSDFTTLLDEQGIQYFEKSDGQLFLKGTSKQIFEMLIHNVKSSGAKISITTIDSIKKNNNFVLKGDFGEIETKKVVVATGGLSYPGLGASDFGYKIAKQFGHKIIPCRPALVPLTLSHNDRKFFSSLSGISFRARIKVDKFSITDDCLITHKGLSGPAILRISLHWKKGDELLIDTLPDVDILSELEKRRSASSKIQLKTFLSHYFPDRLAAALCELCAPSRPLNTYSQRQIASISAKLHDLRISPQGTEGFDKAEVTLGGIDTHELSSQTMESKICPGLYFIGEVTDVTGDLGGYNLHWAWASASAAADLNHPSNQKPRQN